MSKISCIKIFLNSSNQDRNNEFKKELGNDLYMKILANKKYTFSESDIKVVDDFFDELIYNTDFFDEVLKDMNEIYYNTRIGYSNEQKKIYFIYFIETSEADFFDSFEQMEEEFWRGQNYLI